MNIVKKRGARILLLEDSPVVSMKTEDMLEDAGFFVVGPAYDMKQGIELATREQIDAAVLDLNIRGEKSFEVMEILEERDIPFVITSGYASWQMPEEWLERPRLLKPFEDEALIGQLREIMDDAATTEDDAASSEA